MIMYLLDKQQNIVQAITDGILEAKMTEEINTADKLVFSLVQTKRLPSEIYFVCISATRGDAFLMFKIISESVKDDRIEYTCIESAYDELKSYTYIRDIRPQDKTASEMLQIALANTRWELGHSEETVRKRTNFYYISTLEAIQKVVELFKVELTFTVVIDPITNRIVRRQVNLYSQQGDRTGKRFEYGSNLLSVTREESSEDLVTALVGRGKGEQLGDGNDDTVDGYGRRIMFTDVVWSKANGNPTDKPAGQEYIEDKEATKLYGFDDGKPRIGIAVFEDIEDVNQLINATWAALQVAKRPKVSFKASALDIGDLGLGDTVAIIRHELNIEYFTRVYKVEHDLLDKNNNMIELGDDFSEKSLTNYVASAKQVQEETSRVANIALTSANDKNKNFYSNVKPTTAAEGDNLFLDLGNDETEYYVWRNGNWELILSTAEIKVTKKEVDKALEDIEDVRSKADQAYHSAENAHLTADAIYKDFMSVQTDMSAQIVDASQKAQETADNYTKMKYQVDSDLNALTKVTDNLTSNVGKLTTDVNGVKGQYAALDGRITEFSAGLEGVNAQLKDAKGQLSTVKLTADSAVANFSSAKGDIASLKTKANEIEQQMLSKVGNDIFESFRASTAQELRSKLTATDLNGYVRTSEFTHTSDSLKANITTIGDQINKLDIGGRNLLKQSQLGSKYQHDAWYETFGGVAWNNDTVELNVGDKDCVQIEQRVYNIEPDTDYVFSFDLNFADGQHLDKQGFIFWEFTANDFKQNTKVYKDNWNIANMSNFPNTPGRAGKQLVIHTQPDTHALIFMVRSLKGAKLPFRLSKVKLEKGNKPTDWSPAPEDFSEQLTAVNNTLQLYNTEFSLLKDGMTLRISEINKINDQINGFKVGGRNYLQGSIDFTWPTGIGQNNVTPTFEMQGDTKIMHLSSGYAGGVYTKWGGAFPNGELQVGDDYTLSFDAKGRGIFKVVKNESETGDGSLSGTSLTSDWKRYSVSGKINSLNKAYVIYFNGGYDVYIRHVKIEKGNKPTDYTQAPEDIAKQLSKVDDTLKSQSLDLKVLKDGMQLRINEINNVNDRFNNLMIGGTNLLDRTSSEARSNDAPTTGWIEGAAYNTLDALTESRYVLSFEARGDVNGQRIGTFLWHGGLGGRNISKKSTTSQGETFTAGDGQSFVTLTTQWQRYWVLYEVDPDNTRKTAIVGRRWADSKPNGKVYVRKVKLESGNKATDWSPAPEDTANQLLNVGNTLKTYQTELNVLKDGMTFRTSEIARVNDRIDKLGIQNLVYNSEFSNNAEGWTNIGSNAAGTILFSNNEWDSWQGSNGLAFRTLATSTSTLLSQSKRFKVLNWQRISASVQLHVTGNITNSCDAGMEIVFYPDETSGNEIKRVSQVTSRVNNISNGFAKLLYVNDVEVPANAKFATLRLWTYRVGNIIFNQPMVTFNSSYLPYARDNKSLGVLSEKYAALDVKVNGINSVVANKADVSYVDQRANQWKLELTGLVIGGTNLVPLTNQGVRDLYVENKFGQMSYTEKRIYGVRGININNTSPAPSNGWFVIGKNVTLSKFKPDTDYVISFNLRGDTSIRAYAMIDIRGTNAQNSISVGDPGYNLELEAGRICKIEKKIHTATSFTDVGQVLYINCIELSRVRNLELWDLKIEQGNKATAWSPAPEDNMAAITAVRNELNTAIDLRVQKGELLSQINMQAGHTLIQSKKIYLDADSVVFSGRAFIPDAAITNINADKINAGTINGANVNVINLNANNITSGSLDASKVMINGVGTQIRMDNGQIRLVLDTNWETFFDNHGMHLKVPNARNNPENIGGITNLGNTKNFDVNGPSLYVDRPGGGDTVSFSEKLWDGNFYTVLEYDGNGSTKDGITGLHYYKQQSLHGDARIIYIDGARDPLMWGGIKWDSSTQSGYYQPTLRLGYNGDVKGDSGVSFLWNSIKPFGTVDMTGTKIRVNDAEDVLQFNWASWSDWTAKIPCLRRPTGGGGIGFGSDGNAILFGGGKRKALFQM